VNPAPANRAPANPQLVILNKPPIPLRLNILNVGRSRENHIVIDDPAVSRHHLQLRLRAGRYMLFDTQSNSGTYVNGVRVKEHTLQAGDVILIGTTQLVYTEDSPLSDTQTGTYPMPGIDVTDHPPRE
jgi:pSer/pThr/pTyr-binding forkhead associated (FHA) protein